MVLNGIDIFNEDMKRLRGARIGVLCNQASLNKDLVHVVDLVAVELPGALKAILGPQHGFGGQDQDNMIETPHSMHTSLNVPIYSLYERHREPPYELMEELDVLLVDLQDVGTRVYTFSSTLLGCMRIASKAGTKVIVLDRPNPLDGNTIEGNLLIEEMFSFVGNLPIPMRHGLTLGEIALALKDYYGLDLDLEIIPMKGWERWMKFDETGLRWLMPSPNMPSPNTSMVYPGTVLLEATNISEGRGTTRPFEIIGAPFIEPKDIRKLFSRNDTKGIILQDYIFRPTFNKWQGLLCKGFMLHVTDKIELRSYRFVISLLRILKQNYPNDFLWKDPPYEYEYQRMPFDIVSGDPTIRDYIEKEKDLNELFQRWEIEHIEYKNWRKPYLIY